MWCKIQANSILPRNKRQSVVVVMEHGLYPPTGSLFLWLCLQDLELLMQRYQFQLDVAMCVGRLKKSQGNPKTPLLDSFFATSKHMLTYQTSLLRFWAHWVIWHPPVSTPDPTGFLTVFFKMTCIRKLKGECLSLSFCLQVHQQYLKHPWGQKHVHGCLVFWLNV